MARIIIFGCFVIFLVLSVLSVASVSASYGISLSYWPGKPLRIFPGETKNVELALQNMGDKDENVNLVLSEGAEIASMKEGSYLVKKKTKDTVVLVKIHIPTDVPTGETYNVAISSQAAPPGSEGGVVTIGTSMVTSFKVITVSEPTLPPPEKNLLTMWIAISAVLAALVGWYLLKRKKKS